MINKSLIRKRDISGVSLLEVLITILIIAIGMLGMAALQVKTLNTTQESYSRSQALSWIDDAASRIRANSAFIVTDPSTTFDNNGAVVGDPNTNAYTNNKASGTFHEWCKRGNTPYVANNLCTGSCNARQLALSDIDNVCLSLDRSGVTNASIGVACFDRDAASPADADNCSAGSKMVVYAAWSQQKRTDSGDQVIQNTRCQKAPLSLDNGYSCVVIELVP